MKPSGIQFRLLLLGIAPLLILGSSLAYYFIQYHSLDIENELKEKGQITINQLAISSSYGISYGDTEILNKISDTLLDEPDVVLVQIIDTLGNDLALSKSALLPAKKELIYFQHPVTIPTIKRTHSESTNPLIDQYSNIPENTIGTVIIALSLEKIHKKQQTYLLNNLLLIFIVIISTILLAVRLGKTITYPIISLTNTANNLAAGNMNARVPGSSTAEIDTLCQSFNSMVIGMQETHNSLTHQINLAVDELSTTLSNLEEKNISLEKTTLLAISQNKTKSQFLAHISHEIRTPMNGVLGFVELLSKSSLSVQQLEHAQLIKTSATSLLVIVNEILDYSSLETGNFKINISTFNLRENIENCALTIFPASNKVQIIIDIDNNAPTLVSTDPIRLQQIITNLLGNACKNTTQGHIVIRCRLLDTNSLYISISDTGCGIHQDKIQYLFQPFLQTSDYAVNNEPGTGLGLTICKNIVERLNGKMGVCTQFNTGSTFWFNLPVSASETEQLETQQQTIAVIDSFSLRRNALVKQLTHIGYLPFSCKSVAEFETQKKNNYSLIFYAKKGEKYDGELIQNKLGEISNAKVIYLHSDKNATTSANILTLPCRSYFLKNIIKTTSKTNIFTPKSAKTSGSKRSSSFSIFIADDNEINRLLLKSQLELHCKNITLANDGKAALSCLQKNKYDLILLDLQMPYFTGQELIKIIKQPDSTNKDSPVIAITAHAQSQQRKTLIEAGFDECLIKPVLLEQLFEILDLWLPKEDSNLDYQSGMNDYVAILLDKTAGNSELTLNLFSTLFSELQEQSDAIEQALRENELSVAEEITHKLHGSVSFCGFTDLQACARTLEVSLSQKDSPQINPNFLLLKNKIIAFLSLKENILHQLLES
jgi:two-component system sensor histidine kinase BarA